MDEETIHEMNGYREGRVTVWYCVICARQVQVIEGVGIVTVFKGNQSVTHQMTGGITFGAVVVEQASINSAPDAFARWADETDIEAMFGDQPIP